MKKAISKTQLLLAPMAAVALLLAADGFCCGSRHHRVPTFNLTAQPAYLNQPDGEAVYSWGYGCNGAPAGFAPCGHYRRRLATRCRFPGPR